MGRSAGIRRQLHVGVVDRPEPPGYVAAMANPYGIELNDEALRWAAAEGVSEEILTMETLT